MKSQPNRDYKSDDVVMTPEPLAKKIINHFNPEGSVLEPCKGSGVFYNNFNNTNKYWCEISENIDFFDFDKKVDWIITNPPWSKIRNFLIHSMELSDNIVFLFTINHLWTKARLRDIKEMGFGIKEIIIFDTPNNFPQSGFQVGVVYIKKHYIGNIKFTDWRG